MGTGDSFPGIKWQGREADYSPPSSAEVKNVDLYLHSPICLHGVVLKYPALDAWFCLRSYEIALTLATGFYWSFRCFSRETYARILQMISLQG
jgi:hypothetical protein